MKYNNNYNMNNMPQNNYNNPNNNNYNYYQRRKNSNVIDEIQRVKNSGNISTKIEGLNKTFLETSCFCKTNKIKAVNNLYLCLDQKEQFGL